MKNNWEKWLLIGLTGISVVLAVALYGMMPERMITHWGVYGQPNGWMSKFWGMAMFPLINALMLGVYFFVPKFEPKKENVAEFRREYDRLMLWIFGVLNYIFGLSFLYNLGVVFDMGKMVMLGLGVMYIAIGTMLPKTKQNFMVGIRTPWTLASEKVWGETHILGGRLFVVSGVLTLFAVFLPSMWGFGVSIGSVLLSSLVVMIYSWKEYHVGTRK
jgi:uncharacterized membrane protein